MTILEEMEKAKCIEKAKTVWTVILKRYLSNSNQRKMRDRWKHDNTNTNILFKTHLKITTAKIQIRAQALKRYFKTNVSWIKYIIFDYIMLSLSLSNMNKISTVIFNVIFTSPSSPHYYEEKVSSNFILLFSNVNSGRVLYKCNYWCYLTSTCILLFRAVIQSETSGKIHAKETMFFKKINTHVTLKSGEI